MLDPLNIPEVQPQELLARYIFSKSHFSNFAQRVKAGAFLPPPNLEFSVTRHLNATETELWDCGHGIAEKTERTLYGRADALAANYQNQMLRTESDPQPENPNHAIVVGWPQNDKPAQKLIAQEIAAVAKYVPINEAYSQG